MTVHRGILAALGAAALFGISTPIAKILLGAMPPLLLAGLLVGFGTRMGSGCTSGHGVLGLARLSPRSFTAARAHFGT